MASSDANMTDPFEYKGTYFEPEGAAVSQGATSLLPTIQPPVDIQEKEPLPENNSNHSALRKYIGVIALAISVICCIGYGAYRFYKTSCEFSVLLAGVVAIGLIVLYAYYRIMQARGTYRFEKLFVCAGAFLGLLYVFVFPIFTVPDEVYHYLNTYKYSNFLMFLDAPNSACAARQCDVDMAAFFNGTLSPQIITQEHYDAIFSAEFFASDTSSTLMSLTGNFSATSNLPQLRVVPALGIVIAKLLNLGAVPTFYAGRLFSLVYFLLFAYWAVKLTPVAKKGFAALLLMPMTMHLAASYSYDVGIIGMAVLLTALLLKAVYEEGPIRTRLVVAIALVTVALAPCKSIYAVISGIALAVPTSRFSGKIRAWLFRLGIPLLAAFSLALVQLPSLLTFVGITTVDASNAVDAIEAATSSSAEAADAAAEKLDWRGSESGHFYTMSYLISHPSAAVKLFVDSFYVMSPWWARTFIGGALSWFQSVLWAPTSWMIAFYVILVLAFIRSKDDETKVGLPARLWFFVCAFVAWLAVVLSMAIGCTFDTEAVILGVQGRYFIPVAVMAFLIVRLNHIRIPVRLTELIVFASVLANGLYLVRLIGLMMV